MIPRHISASSALILFTLLLPSLVFAYTVFIPHQFNERIKVFNASVGLNGCKYHLRTLFCAEASNLHFSVSENGLVQASKSGKDLTFTTAENSCSFRITVDSCHNSAQIEIPLVIHVHELPDGFGQWSSRILQRYSTKSPTVNVSLQFPNFSRGKTSSWTQVLRLAPLSALAPAALEKCDVKEHLVRKRIDTRFKLHKRALYVSTELLQQRHPINVDLIQFIQQCSVSESNSALLADDRVPIHVKILPENVESLETRENIPFLRPLKTNLRMEPSISRRKRNKRSARRTFYFRQSVRIVDILENRPAGTNVVTLEVYNPSSLPLRYSWYATSDKRSLDMFSLDNQTGTVKTRVNLDRETMSSHRFRVTATSGTLSTACSLTIRVTDMNDNLPRFEEQTYIFRLKENENIGAYVGKVTASDNDSGDNGRISYSVRGLAPSDNVFAINDDGELTLSRRLDREIKSQYSFQVVASDKGTTPQRSSTQVKVIVDDVNDNSPRFRQSTYRVRISENTKRNTKIATVVADDEDAGQNGHVTYTLPNGNDKRIFSIGRETGEITITSDVSFENNPNGFNVRVRAQDGGRPPRSEFCFVRIILVDINDNAPQFLSSPYIAVLYEDLALGSDVTRVNAVDLDSGENGRLTYSFLSSPANLPFRINNTSGEIVLSGKLDYEKASQYSLTVKASDHGIPPKSSTAKVDITIRNINDNVPKFSAPVYNKRVTENMQVGREVARVQASDGDVGTTLNYRIISGNVNNKFSIATRSNIGMISLVQSLDFNEKHNYVLTILCSDGTHTSTAVVRINVTDANTNAPEFIRSQYDVTVPEDVKIGKIILQVRAEDRDEGENARITYSFNPPTSAFLIDGKTGEIKTRKTLDFDVESQILLTVLAEDNGLPKLSDRALVTIYLQDKNDNSPKFRQARYSASVQEDVREGFNVVRIEADDKDSGLNGEVYYTFVGGDDGNGYFTIDRSTGVIRTASSLDREYVADYDLIAYACDRGTPARKTSVTIHVTVTDVDDNPPQFASDELVFEVREDSPIGSTVATLQAVDPDEGGQSHVRYELAPDLEMLNVWNLDLKTGELSPTATLDYETRANYTLIVSAYSNTLLSQVTVHINLVDVNDNPPVLNDFEIIFNNYRTFKPYTFPFGPIGRVPAFDPDVSSQLRYKFVKGNEQNLLILNETSGELRLSSKLDNDRELSKDFLIEVSDGKYRVNGTCQLKVVPITDEMLTNSVTVRVQEMSQEYFLSNALQQFVRGLSQILNVSSQNVFIFNVQNDTDVMPHAVVNVSFSARHAAGYFFTTQYLQEQVYLNRSLLANYSMQNVMPFDDNICLREPCENYMRCVSALYFNSSAPFVSTRTVLFRPIHPVSGLRCRCPEGFAGQGCENEVNLCYPSRCHNSGQCVSVEGGYVCVCNHSYTGQNCEINLIGSKCSEAEGICKNGAKCQSHVAGGFRCDCDKTSGIPQEELTQFCELRGRSFRKGDFAMFTGITRQWRFTLSLSFATRDKMGLLLYNGRFNHEHDYFALEIVDGQVQVNFSTGQDYTVVRPFIQGGVNDGKWHTVQIEYRNKPKREVLGPGHTGPSNIKVVTVTVDPDICDSAILANWKKSLGNYTCTATGEQGGTKTSLDLTTPLLLGGVPSLPERYQVHTRHFVGCLRDLFIDYRRVDMSAYVANHGSHAGCSTLRDHCGSKPCGNGKCENTWGTYKCKCRDGNSGKRCERIKPVVHKFQGYGCLKHKQVTALQPVTLPWRHSVAIRTTRPAGTILYMKIGSNMEVELSIQRQRLRYSLLASGKKSDIEIDAIVNDGEWHDISVEWTQSQSASVQIHVQIDDTFAEETFQVDNVLPASGRSTSVQALYVGGKWTSRGMVTGAFVGCIRGVEFSAGGLVHGVTDENLTLTNRAKVSSGCRTSNACNAPRNTCPANSNCIQVFDSYKCECHKGYVGEQCVPACSLDPCREGSHCVMKSSARFGYTCQCSSPLFYGRTCQSEHVQPCPAGWHGYPVCVPCNCPVERNFDPDCKNDRGECSCKKNYYYSSEKDMCLPCNCYHVGSYGLNCSSEIGQCMCKASSIIGKQCNKCSSKFAEVTDQGCRVRYDQCPQSIEDGILWRRAQFGKTNPAQCPRGSVGIATRVCLKEDGWLSPVLSNCTSIAYNELKRDLQYLASKPASLAEHHVRTSREVVLRLFEASNSTDHLYEGDVLMTYELLLELLLMQNSLTGFDLTSAQDPKFNDQLLESTSHVLELEYIDHWRSLMSKNSQRQQVNSARLLQVFETYVATLTNNLQGMYYDLMKASSENVHMLIQTFSNKEQHSFSLGETINGTNVTRPVSVSLTSEGRGAMQKVPETATVGIMQFSTLGQILPMDYHDSRLDMRRPQKPFINSAVVTVVTHNWANASTDRFKKNIVAITFPLLREDRSNPQCVFWNFTVRDGRGLGGWSQKGCTTRSSNKTHVVCACSHLTSFAVITDEEITSVTEQIAVQIVLYTSVAIVITCILLILALSCCLEDVKSNHARIHNNFAMSVLLSEICFTAGIQQTAYQYVCMALAIFIHFFFMSTFAWVFVEGLHLYRMIKEKRDVNKGHMRIYYLFGWGIPAIITALSVGLDAKGFGNAHFCWISTDDLLVWSFAGPLIVCLIVCIILFFLTLGRYLTSNITETKRFDKNFNLKTSFIFLPVVGALWTLALYAVNENRALYYYAFSLINVLLGILLVLFHSVLNKEVREALQNVKDRRYQRAELNTTRQHLLKNSLSQTPDTSNGPRRINMLTSASSTSTTTTARRANHQDSSMFHDISDNSDSESDMSDSSMSLASTHSSDEDDEMDENQYLNMNNSSNWPHQNGHLPMRASNHDRGLVVHSTPKEKDHDNNYHCPTDNGNGSNKADSYSKMPTLPMVSEGNGEHHDGPHYLAISNRKDPGSVKSKEDKMEMIPMQDMDSLPKKGILKNGRRSKPPTPVRVDSLQRNQTHIDNGPDEYSQVSDETSLLKSHKDSATSDKVLIKRGSPGPKIQEQVL